MGGEPKGLWSCSWSEKSTSFQRYQLAMGILAFSDFFENLFLFTARLKKAWDISHYAGFRLPRLYAGHRPAPLRLSRKAPIPPKDLRRLTKWHNRLLHVGGLRSVKTEVERGESTLCQSFSGKDTHAVGLVEQIWCGSVPFPSLTPPRSSLLLG